jgi:hypothetical protein
VLNNFYYGVVVWIGGVPLEQVFHLFLCLAGFGGGASLDYTD